MNRHFSEEDIQMVNRYMTRGPTSLVIGEMHMKATMRYHVAPVRNAIINKTQKVTSVGEDVGKWELCHTVGRNAKWCGRHGKQCGGS